MRQLLSTLAVFTAAVIFLAAAPATPSGKIVTFDPPCSVYTNPGGINASNHVTGYYFDGSRFHGFLRDPDGTITSFDVPGARSTLPIAINNVGNVVGIYKGSQSGGFIRAADGTFTTFAIAG